ncbi:hypothetical protein GGP41_004204 [Bipolaris sorokiniana]|uniref:Uncharacterized protein n=1 Tax=Cochliobolus sativus TaxID=45130 RepID=A0A8H5ZL82_COCSA|nr:hypothetical protein GGP41_004204 [Bipolaris sorokiniana]
MWWRRHHSRAQPCLVFKAVPGCQTHHTYRSPAQCPRYPRHPQVADYHYFQVTVPLSSSSPLLAENYTACLWPEFKQKGCATSCSQLSCMYIHWYMQSVYLPGRW